MAIITDRDIFLGAHVTAETKEAIKVEADRRKVSVSHLVSNILEEWLVVAQDEQVETPRSNKRTKESKEKFKDVPLPLGE